MDYEIISLENDTSTLGLGNAFCPGANLVCPGFNAFCAGDNGRCPPLNVGCPANQGCPLPPLPDYGCRCGGISCPVDQPYSGL